MRCTVPKYPLKVPSKRPCKTLPGLFNIKNPRGGLLTLLLDQTVDNGVVSLPIIQNKDHGKDSPSNKSVDTTFKIPIQTQVNPSRG